MQETPNTDPPGSNPASLAVGRVTVKYQINIVLPRTISLEDPSVPGQIGSLKRVTLKQSQTEKEAARKKCSLIFKLCSKQHEYFLLIKLLFYFNFHY